MSLAGLVLAASLVVGQVQIPTALPESTAAGAEAAPVVVRQAQVAAQFEKLRARRDAAVDAAPAILEQVDRQIELTEELVFLLGRESIERERLDDLEIEIEGVAGERLANSSVADAPTALTEVDAAADRLTEARARAVDAGSALTAARSALELARNEAAACERSRLAAELDVAAGKSSPQGPLLDEKLRTAQLQCRVHQANVDLLALQIRVLERSQELHGARVTLAEEQLERLRRNAVFTPKQLEEQLLAIDAEDGVLSEQITEVRGKVADVERAWREERSRLDGGDPQDPTAIQAERAARHRVELLRLQLSVTSERRELVRERKLVWQRRQSLMTGDVEAEDRRRWEDETERRLEELDGRYAVANAELVALRQRRQAAKATVASLEGRELSSALRAARVTRGIVDDLVQVREEQLVSIDGARTLLGRLERDLERLGRDGRWLAGFWSRTQRALSAAWRFQLGSINDRPVTAGGVLKGLLLLIVAVIVAHFATQKLGDLITARFKLEEGATATLENLSFYLAVALAALLALKVANIPLTAFTILGGALAIGVGFGTQNLMNNFISGLILLMERPVRVGDLIEIHGSTRGIIRRIGGRSTQVRTGEGVDILIPNSSLLEQEVVNWTLSDNRVRAFVSVGVAYGSPTREVARLLRRAADEHGRVLEKPDPFVVFRDFGDNSLVFEVHFWVRVKRPMDVTTLQSDLRFMIDGMFRDAGIVIAFPQRDIHIDGLGPLSVRMLPPAVEAGDADDSDDDDAK